MIHKKATLLDKILIVLLILSILVGLAVSSDYSDKVDDLQAEIEHLTEVVDATQQITMSAGSLLRLSARYETKKCSTLR